MGTNCAPLLADFIRSVLVWCCRLPLSLCVWEGLRFVIVALPGLFSFLFFFFCGGGGGWGGSGGAKVSCILVTGASN